MATQAEAAAGNHRAQQTAGESSRERAGHDGGRSAGRPALIARGSGYGRANGSSAVRDIQRRLNRLGYPAGPVDGLFGPRTEAAVVTFQRARGLVADGIVGRRTQATLRRSGMVLSRGAGFERRSGSSAVRRLQRQLKRVGHRPGPVDGLFGPRTEAAVLAFQAAAGLERDGIVGPRTRSSLRQHIRRDARQPVSAPERDRQPAPATSTAGEPATTPAHSEPPVTPAPSEPIATPTPIEPIATRTPSAPPVTPTTIEPPATPTASEPPATPSAIPTAPTTGAGDDEGLATGWLVLATILAFAIGLALAAPDRRRRRHRPDTPTAATTPAGETQDEPAPAGEMQDEPAPAGEMQDEPAPTGEAQEDSPAPTGESQTLAHMSEGQGPIAPVGGEASPRPPRVVTIDMRPEQTHAGTEDPQRHVAQTASTGASGADVAPRATGYASIPALGPRSELAEQERRIRAACERHGLELIRVTHDVERVTRGQDTRPGLELAFQSLASGEASVLVVPELARLSRSAVDLGDIVAQFEGATARLLVIDPELDTATPEGRLAVRGIRTAGQLEERHARDRGRPAPTGARRTGPIGSRRIGDHARMSGRRSGPDGEEER